ncbi:MAG: hypothetical protein QM704_07275 [Anaeromyxobacteraceae bacterium]
MAEMRAAQLQEDLVALAALGDEVARRVLADLPPEVVARIREATRVDWLSIREVHEPFLHAVRRHAGDEGLRTFARVAALRSATSRFVGPIIEPLVRVFGLGPEVMLRVPPTAYRATFRGMGELVRLSAAPNLVRFALRGLPSDIDREPMYLVVAGALEGAVAHAKVAGRAEILAGEGGADAVFEVRWPSPRPSRDR